MDLIFFDFFYSFCLLAELESVGSNTEGRIDRIVGRVAEERREGNRERGSDFLELSRAGLQHVKVARGFAQRRKAKTDEATGNLR